MKKLGIVVDSSSGLDQSEIEKKGWYFLPLITEINGKEYKAGVDLTIKDFYKNVSINDDIKTGTTSPGIIEEVIAKASKECENVIVYTISKGLSGQYQAVKTFTQDFDNVHVIDSTGLAAMQVNDCEILEKRSNLFEFEEICEYADKMTKEIFGILTPKTLNWLKKGGRISGATAALGNLLNIVPAIGFNKNRQGKLEKVGKGRTFVKTCLKMGNSFVFKNKEDWQYFVLHADNETEAKEVLEKFISKNNLEKEDVKIGILPPVIAAHTGPGSLVIARSLKK